MSVSAWSQCCRLHVSGQKVELFGEGFPLFFFEGDGGMNGNELGNLPVTNDFKMAH